MNDEEKARMIRAGRQCGKSFLTIKFMALEAGPEAYERVCKEIEDVERELIQSMGIPAEYFKLPLRNTRPR